LVASPEGAPLAFEVPRPLRQGGTWRFALDVWREERARALLIAVPRLAPNQTVAAAPTGAGSAFHAAHTAMHAALANPTPGLIVQVRGHGGWRALQDHGILALETPIFDIAQVPEMVSGLAARVEARIGPPVRMYRSPSFKPGRDAPLAMAPISRQDADLVGLVSQPNVQRDLARRYGGTRFLRLWLSERVRADYLLERPPALPGSLSDALGDPLTEPGLAALLREPLAEPPPEPDAALAARFEAAFDLARRYAITDNPHLLRLLLDRAAGDAGLRVWRGFAPGEGRPYLLVEQSSADEVHRGLVYEHAEGDIWQSPAPEAPPISLRGHGGARVHGQRVAEGAP
ncbi:MAG: hypothetical protein KC620_23940, partial [Myxococcales bacterium]|nr:hypothetical protein [Myxococcales bacterium]